MKGKYSISIWNKKIKYDLTIRRNITIIQGDSATGKTHLVEMIQEYVVNGDASGIQMVSDAKCIQAPMLDWQHFIETHPGYIIFFDEEAKYVVTEEFARMVKKSDNYFVIVTREALPMLPYSVEEIYGIRRSGKYAETKQVYNELYQIYGYIDYSKKVDFSEVITEDSNSGYDFWSKYYAEEECVSANGKSNVYKKIDDVKRQLIIADGAAFGCEMSRIMQMLEGDDSTALYLPESFEYLLLKSDLFNGKELQEQLENTCKYADSAEYMSWEQFYTAKIKEISQGQPYQYFKENLNEYYLSDKNMAMVEKVIPEIVRKKFPIL